MCGPQQPCPEIADIAPRRKYFLGFFLTCLATFKSSIRVPSQPCPAFRRMEAGDATGCGEEFLQGAHPARQEHGLQQPQEKCQSLQLAIGRLRQAVDRGAHAVGAEAAVSASQAPRQLDELAFVGLSLRPFALCLLLLSRPGCGPGIAQAQPGRALMNRSVPGSAWTRPGEFRHPVAAVDGEDDSDSRKRTLRAVFTGHSTSLSRPAFPASQSARQPMTRRLQPIDRRPKWPPASSHCQSLGIRRVVAIVTSATSLGKAWERGAQTAGHGLGLERLGKRGVERAGSWAVKLTVFFSICSHQPTQAITP